MTAVLVAVPAGVVLTLVLLTAVGAHECGMPWPVAVLVGIPFPVTWYVWYAKNEAHQDRHQVS